MIRQIYQPLLAGTMSKSLAYVIDTNFKTWVIFEHQPDKTVATTKCFLITGAMKFLMTAGRATLATALDMARPKIKLNTILQSN